jgi:hypothetical protein
LKKWDDLDEAIIGPAMVWTKSGGQIEVLVYNAEIIRNILMSRDGMTFEDAREFIEYNIEGAYIGLDTPILVWPNDLYRVTDHDTEH